MNLFANETSAKQRKLLDLAGKIDACERYTAPHAARIAALADALAVRFNMSEGDRENLKFAALVHDIGELAMDREYLGENRSLTEHETADMHRHPVIGEQEASKIDLPRAVQLLVRWHHEWWNGAGYPDALRGEQIPLGARILRVCDTFSALTEARPYSEPATVAEAREYLMAWSGIEFDPNVVLEFLSIRDVQQVAELAVAAEAA